MVRLMTGLGVEDGVAMTGELSLSGVISKVSGLEGKLRFAHSSERIQVVVIPRDNLAEAQALVAQHGLSNLRLLPVGHMWEVVRLLFLGSVHAQQQPAGRSDTPRACRPPTRLRYSHFILRETQTEIDEDDAAAQGRRGAAGCA